MTRIEAMAIRHTRRLMHMTVQGNVTLARTVASDDPDVRRMVEELLAAHAEYDRLLARATEAQHIESAGRRLQQCLSALADATRASLRSRSDDDDGDDAA